MSILGSPLHAIDRLWTSLDRTTIANVFGFGGNTAVALQQKDFDVDPDTGFFPARPLPRLPSGFQIWEDAVERARATLSLGRDMSKDAIEKRAAGEQWRNEIASWPVFDTTPLHEDGELLKRAHWALAHLVHFYAHSIPPPEGSGQVVIPKSLAIPLVRVSKVLDTAPVLTFADVVLWNYEIIDPDCPLSIENIRYPNTLSGTETESQFYMLSAAVELKGVEMLKIIDDYIHLPNVTDHSASLKVGKDLARLTKIVDELTEIFRGTRAAVDPYVFFWYVRPWWVGGVGEDPSRPKWIFEGVPDASSLRLGGPSAGQSSVMHALDIFLDVDHKLQRSRTPAPSAENKRADRGFMERMRLYMPGKHREYLAHISRAQPSLRELVERTPCLRENYNAAVLALKTLRDVHIRVVCRYIVNMSSSTPPPDLEKQDVSGPVRGTGGSALSNLLKAGRDATQRTMV